MSAKASPTSDSAVDYRPLVLLLVGLLLTLGAVGRELLCRGCRGGSDQRAATLYLWLQHGEESGGYRFPDRATADRYLAGLSAAPGGPGIQTGNLATIVVAGGSLSLLPAYHPRLAPFFELPLPINRADAAVLQTLPGVGPKLAGAIVRSREEQGPFKSLDELQRVKGIGPQKLARLREQIILN